MARLSWLSKRWKDHRDNEETEIWSHGSSSGGTKGSGSGGTKGSGSGSTKGSGSGGTKGSGSGGTKGSGASASSTKSYHNGGVEGDSFAAWYNATLATKFAWNSGEDGGGSKDISLDDVMSLMNPRGSEGRTGTKGSATSGASGSGFDHWWF